MGHCMIVCLQAVSPRQIPPTQQPTCLLCFSQVASSQRDRLPLHVSFLKPISISLQQGPRLSLTSETSSCPIPRAAGPLQAALSLGKAWEVDSQGDAEPALAQGSRRTDTGSWRTEEKLGNITPSMDKAMVVSSCARSAVSLWRAHPCISCSWEQK